MPHDHRCAISPALLAARREHDSQRPHARSRALARWESSLLRTVVSGMSSRVFSPTNDRHGHDEYEHAHEQLPPLRLPEEGAAHTTQIIVRVGDAVRASIDTFNRQVYGRSECDGHSQDCDQDGGDIDCGFDSHSQSHSQSHSDGGVFVEIDDESGTAVVSEETILSSVLLLTTTIEAALGPMLDELWAYESAVVAAQEQVARLQEATEDERMNAQIVLQQAQMLAFINQQLSSEARSTPAIVGDRRFCFGFGFSFCLCFGRLLQLRRLLRLWLRPDFTTPKRKTTTHGSDNKKEKETTKKTTANGIKTSKDT
ncbi:hypothetical protein PINS_up001908 [Pythium insidiosum]|nr:hypothetical protein PINS_up001908 [Pythium insidiosum]